MTDKTTHQQALPKPTHWWLRNDALGQDGVSIHGPDAAYYGSSWREVMPLYTADQMRAYAAEAVRAAMGWISVEDRMPPDGEEVLVCVNYCDGSGPYVMVDRWVMHREDPLGMGGPTIETGFDWDNNDPHDVSHWMPLPAAPSPGAEGVVKQDLNTGGPDA